jgi:hypothetical protein
MPSRHVKPGYLLIDNRHAPPVSLAQAAAAGREVLGAGVAGVFEADVYSCAHCAATVVKNPDRVRPRGYCRSCDAFTCDPCTAFGVCSPVAKQIEEALTRIERGQQPGAPHRG